MAYAESVKGPAPKRKHLYWRGRYADGTYFDSGRPRFVSVRNDDGNVLRFKGKKEAEQAADAKEVDVRRGTLPAGGDALFPVWASWWLQHQNVARSTKSNRRQHLVNHLIPFFKDYSLRHLEQHPELVDDWEQYERGRGYAENSISSWRGTLSLCLGDAVPKRISVNPAERKKGRGRRTSSGRNARAGAGKVITDTLGMFLIAERMSVMTGRDDEFVMIQAGFGHALRLGETIGLEREFVSAEGIDVQWQLYHLAAGDDEELRKEAPGNMLRCPPKDGSVGLVSSPPYLVSLLADFMRANPRQPCECHGRTYVFNGFGQRPRPRGNVTLNEIAAASGVTRSTVAALLNGTRNVSPEKRAAVERAIADTGYVRTEKPGGTSRHWPRNDFERFFHACASGWLKSRDGHEARPVPLAGPWPGVRVKGRNSGGRAEWCWLPVAPGMTPHGWRHSAKTIMEERGVPEVASETRLRHLLPGVSGVYRQVTPAMEENLLGMLQANWEAALDARLEMSPTSTVGIVDRLLRERAKDRKRRDFPRNSPEGGAIAVPMPYRTAPDQRNEGVR